MVGSCTPDVTFVQDVATRSSAPLRVVYLEDEDSAFAMHANDLETIVKLAGFKPSLTRAKNRKQLATALRDRPHIVFSDMHLGPKFETEAMDCIRDFKDRYPD